MNQQETTRYKALEKDWNRLRDIEREWAYLRNIVIKLVVFISTVIFIGEFL